MPMGVGVGETRKSAFIFMVRTDKKVAGNDQPLVYIIFRLVKNPKFFKRAEPKVDG